MSFRCRDGHDWVSSSESVAEGTLCPRCEKPRVPELLEAEILASRRLGRCLSEVFRGSTNKLHWECKRGHRWEALLASIRRGTWCRECSRKDKITKAPLTLGELKTLARQRGGRCLARRYLNRRTKLKWVCRKGHVWLALPESVLRGSWCRSCAMSDAGRRRLGSITRMAAHAASMGGACVSKNYVDSQTALSWKCSLGHVWKASPNNVIRGSWCPYCSQGRGEEYCRSVFERLFDTHFPKSRPDWLTNNEGGRLELDGYSQTLRIAFEHQGGQHFEPSEYFGKNKFRRQRDHDRLKRRLCRKKGIRLVEIPEVPRLLPLDRLVQFIVGELRRNGVRLGAAQKRRVSGYEPRRDVRLESRISEFLRLVSEQEGTVIQRDGDAMDSRCRIRCANAHIWETRLRSVLGGHWCKTCAILKYRASRLAPLAESKGGQLIEFTKLSGGRHKWRCERGHLWLSDAGTARRKWCPICSQAQVIEDASLFAKARAGALLTKKYVGAEQYLEFQCVRGHRFKFRRKDIKRGTWCRKCLRIETIEGLNAIAIAKQGRLISKDYKGEARTLLWSCLNGHSWRATPKSIRLSCWCPMCGFSRVRGSRTKTLAEMQAIASRRGGRCLAKSYPDATTKLEWECKRGHRWWKEGIYIASGKWCPRCSVEDRAEKSRTPIQTIQRLAAARGGALLSKSYQNSSVKLRWRCGSGHTWRSKYNVVKMGSWCPICGRRRATDKNRGDLSVPLKIIRRQRGRCLTSEYKNVSQKLEVICAHGHMFQISTTRLKQGGWCRKCRDNKGLASAG
jgi:hypothetical protein